MFAEGRSTCEYFSREIAMERRLFWESGASTTFVEHADIFEWELIEPQSGASYGWANYTVCCPVQ